MRGFLAMVRKELVHTRREKRLMGYIVGLPIALLFLFGSALRLQVDNLVLAVADLDRTFFSLQVKDRLAQQGHLTLQDADSDQAVRELVRTGEAHVGLVIPAGFSRRVADSEQTTFDLLVDGTMPTVAQAAICGANVLSSPEVTEQLRLDDPDHPAPPPAKPPIKVNQVVLFNPDLRDSDFFLPGTLGVVIMIVSLTLSTGFVREKEQQTIEQLSVTPISRVAIVAGKIVPYAAIVAVDFAVVAVLARLFFALPFRGSLGSVALLAALFILAMLAIGSLISTLSGTQLQATFLNIFTLVMSLLLSGFIFPREAMPDWLQPVTRAVPMTYFVEGIRALTLKGSTLAELARDFLALAGFVVVFGTLCVAAFRKQTA